jgi:hypothetical protein
VRGAIERGWGGERRRNEGEKEGRDEKEKGARERERERGWTERVSQLGYGGRARLPKVYRIY